MSNLLDQKAYSPAEVEAKWSQHWVDNKLFAAQVNSGKETFSIALPPPNVTGELHMGHALSGTIQDVLIRYHRMLGKDVLWQIGTDHAGIGTQIVVEKQIKKNEKTTRHQLGREEFVKRVKAWKEESGNKIIEQMKKLGFSPDWDRCRYTMDEHYSQSVKEAFVNYFNDGLIYRGKRIVNWCPKCLTSLSDLELDKRQGKKKLHYIKYLIKGGDPSKDFVTVATTRPETMFGDTGVAVNPNDDRFKHLLDAKAEVLVPLVDREIPVVGDEHAKMEFGTGALKVTPAHDANDFDIAERQGLPCIITMDEKACMLAIDEVPKDLHGLDRYEARKVILEKLDEAGLLIKIEDYEQEQDLHDRCGTEVEPYLSDQWYVDMSQGANLARIALDTVASDESKFTPKRYEQIFKGWLENIRDWCISRQIWWGHRIPVFYYKDEEFKQEHGHYPYFASAEHSSENLPKQDPKRNIDISSFEVWQDEDVLDTWFSSALWPFETMKDNQAIYDHYYPTQVLATAREIINLWVSRMIYSSVYFEKDSNGKGLPPFKDILIHPVVQTPDGKRMSKSKGNAIDPLELINLYGADASRLWYSSVGVLGQQDVRFPGNRSKNGWASDTIEQNKKFANKLFNASKFVMMSLGDDFTPRNISEIDKSKLSVADKWILDKFHSMLAQLEEDYKAYDLGAITNSIYEFLWFNFCDWYIELSKNNFTEENKQILFHILENSLRALHPIMPFITEEIWQALRTNYSFENLDSEIINSDLDDKYKTSICFAHYPQAKKEFMLAEASSQENISAQMDFIIQVISSLRNIRQTLGINWANEIEVYLHTENEFELASLQLGDSYIKTFTKAKSVAINNGDAPKPSISQLVENTKFTVALAGLVDIDKVKAATQKRIDSVAKDISGLESRLGSEKFVNNAPKEKVDAVRAELEALLAKRGIYEAELANLS